MGKRLAGVVVFGISILLFLTAVDIYAQSPDKEAYNKAGDYISRSMYDAALTEIDKAIQINPHYAEAYLRRGNINYNKNNFDEALLDCNKSIELDPNNINAYRLRAVIYGAKGLYNKALSDYAKILEKNPKNPWALYQKARLCDKTGRIAEAVETYKEFILCAKEADRLTISSGMDLNSGWIISIKEAERRIADLERDLNPPVAKE